MENLDVIYRIEAFLSAVIGGDTPPEPKYRAEYWLAKIAGANITTPEPKYRFEYYLASIAGESVELPEPKDRIDFWLAKIAGADVTTPTPKYRIEYFLDAWAQGGGTEVLLSVTDYAPITLPNAVAKNMVELIQYGTATQSATPTPDAPVDIMCNNGAIRLVHTSGLPLGYKLLEYVGGTGTQYITITGLKVTGADIIESEFQNASTTGYGAIYGIYKTGESSAFYANQTYYGYDASNNKVDTGIQVDTNWHTARHDFVNGTLTVGSTTVSFTPYEFTNTTDCGVLTRYYNGSYGYNFKGNIRKFKVTRDNEVICDLLPAKNSSDEAGLYDLISGNFYTATGGSLAEGSVVDDLEFRAIGTPETLSVLHNSQTDTFTTVDGRGTYVTPTSPASTRIYKQLPLTAGRYTITVPAGYDFIVQYRRPSDNTISPQDYGNYGSWTNGSETVTLDKADTYGYGISLRWHDSPTATIDTTDFTGEIKVEHWTGQTASVANLFGTATSMDEHEIISGTVKRKYGLKAFDGTETIGTSNACFTVAISGKVTSKSELLCSHFPYSTKTSSQTEDMTVISFASSNIGFRYDACADKTAFATYLATQYAAGTPVIVMYPLATEETESVAPQALSTEKGTNAITVDANVSPIMLSAKYYGKES